jgi:hypothetical protein
MRAWRTSLLAVEPFFMMVVVLCSVSTSGKRCTAPPAENNSLPLMVGSASTTAAIFSTVESE